MKDCARCGESKALSEFGRRSDSGKPMSWCRECNRKYQREYAVKVRSDQAARGRENARRRLWINGLTQEQFDALVDRQAHRCAICLDPLDMENPRNSPIDHDHRCCEPVNGKPRCGQCVRGILCARCNSVLGLIQEDPDLLDRMNAYISETVTVREGR